MKRKAIACIVSLALVACVSIGTTLAWLTSSTGELVNTFTVGKISITLDEAKTERNIVQGTERTTEGNSYVLYKGAVLPKDPTVTIQSGSENCYVFMSCVSSDELQSFTAINIDTANWSAVEGTENLYVYTGGGDEPVIVPYSTDDTKLPALFETVDVTGDCPDNITDSTNITVKALAYQSNDNSTLQQATDVAKSTLLS